ncbi:MAG: PQ-loop repeat-containing protein [Marinifilaceae bacterium]|jgi:uncharacterized protein with PQ loop repeat|nr:PQ-loop repeat-containing protein [Marinifilaceae bacterium]
MNEFIGWLGSALFALCALPQAYQTFKTKSSKDLNFLFLLMWFFGEIFSFWYILYDDISKEIYHYPLYFNYLFNLILLFYLLYAKYTYKD